MSTEQNRDRWRCSVVVRACREEGNKWKKARKKKRGNKRGQYPAAPQGGGTEKDEWLGPRDGPRATRTARETAQERGAGAGGERPVLGAQNGPGMDEDPVGPRHRVAGGPVGYKHGKKDGMGPHDNPGE